MEINETVIVASRWFPYYLTYIDYAQSNKNQIFISEYVHVYCHKILVPNKGLVPFCYGLDSGSLVVNNQV